MCSWIEEVSNFFFFFFYSVGRRGQNKDLKVEVYCFELPCWCYIKLGVKQISNWRGRRSSLGTFSDPTRLVSCWEATRTAWVNLGLRGLTLSAGARMADKASRGSVGFLVVLMRDDGIIWYRVTGSGFPCLPLLLCCGCPIGLTYRGAFLNGGAPFGLVLSVLLSGIRIDGECLGEFLFFLERLKHFFWPLWECFSCCSST